jgi:CelD/BcsL family acetyltransferase involved in cellulose biosynthesis
VRDEVTEKRLEIELLATTEDLLAIGSQWQQLHEQTDLEPFNGWEWQVAWWNHLGGDRQPRVLLARDHRGVLRGIIPLSLEWTTLGFQSVRRLGFLSDERVGSDYLDVIATPEWQPAVVAAAADYLSANRDDWDVIEWRDMDVSSDSATLLASGLGQGKDIERIDGLCCPGQDLQPGVSFEDFLRGTRRHDNYRRRRRWLERQPGFRIEISSGGKELTSARDVFFQLHEMRWEEAGGSAGIPDQAVRSFHTEVIDRLAARNQVAFYTLWVGQEPAASVYALVDRHTFYYYQSGMNPAWRPKSVGLVLIGATFADAIGRGLRRYDFLRGEESYKSDWVGQYRQLASWRMHNAGSRGRVACRIDRELRRGKRRLRLWVGPWIRRLRHARFGPACK